MEPALMVAAAGSSVSALLLGAIARWVRRIDQRTNRNHETLHDTANGPGIKRHVHEHREVLLSEDIMDSRHADD